MKRDEYLKDQDVSAFIDWAANLVSGEWGLAHSYTYGKGKKFKSGSLYEAYEEYRWKGYSFDETTELFDMFGALLQKETPNDKLTFNPDIILVTAICILRWGGIPKLDKTLLREGRNRVGRTQISLDLNRNVGLLDPKSADTDDLSDITRMNSGYSKIYSAMIDEFPIYDSRVGCALTSLIKRFCEENALPQVPPLLRLGVPPGRKDRNPSEHPYQFPGAGYSKTHADSNLKAAWILGELAEIGEGDFSKVCRNRRVRALEAALFMIGYQPLEEDAVRKG